MVKEFLISWDKNDITVSDDGDIMIGRNPGSDIFYSDKRLSREHARIYMKGGGLYITDLGSSNGTLVNNKLLKKETELKDKDKVVAGPLHLTIRVLEKKVSKPEIDTAEPFKCPKCSFEIKGDVKFCPGCGEPLENLVSVPMCRKCGAELMDGALFCPQCGDSIKEIRLANDSGDYNFAGTGKRVAAGVVDGAIASVLFLAMVMVPALVGYIFMSDPQSEEKFSLFNTDILVIGGAGFVLYLLAVCCLFGFFWGVKGKSPGTALAGIRIENKEGMNIGFGKGFVRALLFPVFPGWGVYFFSKQKQALHDLAAGSIIVE